MKRLLLTASALASFALPSLALAQPAPPDQRQDQRQENRMDQRQSNRPDNRMDNRQDYRQGVRQDSGGRVFSRDDRSWWRGRPEFRGYFGVRPGYWFIPGSGYIRPDPRWYGYSWRIGGILPFALRSYIVINPYVYGLPPAPPAFRYVFLGNGTIALISRRDGQIRRIYPGLY